MTQAATGATKRSDTDVLTMTLLAVVAVVVLGAVFGATWLPGVAITAIVALFVLMGLLVKGAEAMNEPHNFGQGLTAVLSALILLPAAIAASLVIGLTFGAADAISDYDGDTSSDMSYEECLVDPDTTWEDCAALE
jgi:hypothetical protein